MTSINIVKEGKLSGLLGKFIYNLNDDVKRGCSKKIELYMIIGWSNHNNTLYTKKLVFYYERYNFNENDTTIRVTKDFKFPVSITYDCKNSDKNFHLDKEYIKYLDDDNISYTPILQFKTDKKYNWRVYNGNVSVEDDDYDDQFN